MTSTAPRRDTETGKGLRSGALGMLSSLVIAVSSTAPAFSVAATLGLVVAVAGVHSPGILIVSVLPMLCVAIAFRELNRAEPDCGTTFTWATKAFGPSVGWMGGWGMLAAGLISMAGLSQIAGHYAFVLVGADDLADQTLPVAIAGVAFIALLTWVCYRGIEASARLQQVLLLIELVTLGVFAVMALVEALSGHGLDGAVTPSLSWLNPWSGSASAFANAFLLAVFMYAGWDCALSLNEETADKTRIPGWAGVMSNVLVVCLYVVVCVAALAYAGTEFVSANNEDVLGALSNQIFGSTVGQVLVLCVLTSATAATQTTIMPTARAALAMATEGALPARLARVHTRFSTPGVATITMGVISSVFFILLTCASSNVLADSVSSVGLLYAFYYCLTGFACVWFFRKEIRRDRRSLLVKGVVPFLGGACMLAAFVLSAVSHVPADSSASSLGGVGGIFLITMGTMALGVVVMLVIRRRMPAFFQKR
jgi:amino acid transporter